MRARNPSDQGRAETGGEDESLRPVTPLREQDRPEDLEAQHRREDRGDREIDDQGNEQELVAAEDQ